MISARSIRSSASQSSDIHPWENWTISPPQNSAMGAPLISPTPGIPYWQTRRYAVPRATTSRSRMRRRNPCASNGPLPKITKSLWSRSSSVASLTRRRINLSSERAAECPVWCIVSPRGDRGRAYPGGSAPVAWPAGEPGASRQRRPSQVCRRVLPSRRKRCRERRRSRQRGLSPSMSRYDDISAS